MQQAGQITFDNSTTSSEEDIKLDSEDQSQKEQAKLNSIISDNQDSLLHIKTHKWFDLFPDEISVDMGTVNFLHNFFIGSRRRESAMIEDVMDVEVTTTPFYATLKLMVRSFEQQNVTVGWLNPSEAKRARWLIMGLKIAKQQGIDFTKIPNTILSEKIEALGKSNDVRK